MSAMPWCRSSGPRVEGKIPTIRTIRPDLPGALTPFPQGPFRETSAVSGLAEWGSAMLMFAGLLGLVTLGLDFDFSAPEP